MNSFKNLNRRNIRIILAAIASVGLILTVSIIGIFSSSSVLAPNYSCSATCKDSTPVCGKNGFWYANACLAQCASIETTRHIEVCQESLSVVSQKAESGHAITEEAMKKNDGYQFIGFLEHVDAEKVAIIEPKAEVSTNNLRKLSSMSDNKVVAYAYEVADYVNNKVQKMTRTIGDYYYQDFASLNDEMPGGWVLIEEDGSVYVKVETKDSTPTESQPPSATMELAGNLDGCGTTSTLNGPKRNINNTKENINIKPFSRVKSAEEDPLRRLAVIGEDSRWRVVDSSVSPHRQVGEMAPLGCTGTLVGPKHVVTAAHCLWFRNRQMNGGGSYLASDWFFAGRLNKDEYSTKTKVTRKLIHRRYKDVKQNEFNWDFGIVELDTEIGYDLGWMGIQSSCNESQLDLHVAGYPSDKKRHTMWMAQCGKTRVGCNMRSIGHYCDTAPGMSGSSMWIVDPQDNQYKIRAVHVAGSSQMNRATYIDNEIFNSINDFRGNVQNACPVNANSNKINDTNKTILE